MKTKLNIADIQRHRVNTALLKRRNWGIERNEIKARPKWAGQTLNPLLPCPASGAICGKIWTPKGLCDPATTALLVAVALMASLLGGLFSVLVAFLRCPMFLPFQTSCSLHCIFSFTLTDSLTALSSIHCLVCPHFFLNPVFLTPQLLHSACA